MRASTAKKYQRHRKSADRYGGDLLKTRLGRSTPRPLSSYYSMHFVVRSTKARGPSSFRRPENFSRVHAILEKFAKKHDVKLYRASVNFNHIHLCLGLRDRIRYNRFIRAITSAIARLCGAQKKFWDRRPFSRIVRGPLDEATLMDYFTVNDYEAVGIPRQAARWLIKKYRHINNALRGCGPP